MDALELDALAASCGVEIRCCNCGNSAPVCSWCRVERVQGVESQVYTCPKCGYTFRRASDKESGAIRVVEVEASAT